MKTAQFRISQPRAVAPATAADHKRKLDEALAAADKKIAAAQQAPPPISNEDFAKEVIAHRKNQHQIKSTKPFGPEHDARVESLMPKAPLPVDRRQK